MVNWQEDFPDIQLGGDLYTEGYTRELLSFSPEGELRWRKVLSTAGTQIHLDTHVGALSPSTQGSVVVAGSSLFSITDKPSSDPERLANALIKLDAAGNVIWESALSTTGVPQIYSVTVATSGDSYLQGAIYLSGARSSFIAKISPAGQQLWLKEFTQPISQVGVFKDRLYAFVGGTSGSSLIKLATRNGALLVKRNYTQRHGSLDINALGFVTTGVTAQGVPYIARLDPNDGRALWQRALCTAGACQPLDVKLTRSGAYVAGVRIFNISEGDALVMRYDAATGKRLWSR